MRVAHRGCPVVPEFVNAWSSGLVGGSLEAIQVGERFTTVNYRYEYHYEAC